MCIVSGTEHCRFVNVENITVDSDSLIPHKIKNGSEKYCQENTYDKNIKKIIEENANETIELNES